MEYILGVGAVQEYLITFLASSSELIIAGEWLMAFICTVLEITGIDTNKAATNINFFKNRNDVYIDNSSNIQIEQRKI
jgi:hypothetical protein